MPDRRPWIRRQGAVVVGLFVLALVARSIYLYEGASNPTFDEPIVDSHTYDRIARAFAGGGGLTDEFFWQPLFYPLFLSAVYRLADSSIVVAKLIQLLIGAATCVLTYRLGLEGFDRRTGLLAGAIVALYGPLIFFDGELLSTGWACFWSVALLLLFLKTARAGLGLPFVALGICGALSILTRPTFLPFFFVSFVWLGWVVRRRPVDWRGVAARMALVAAGFAAVAVPAALLSRTHSGRLSMLPASGGINLYIGNNPDSFKTVSIRPGWDWMELTRLPEQHGVVHKKDTSRFFRGEFLRYVRNDPGGFLKGLAVKSGQFVNSRELPRNLDAYVYREWSLLLSVLLWKAGPFGFPFGVLLPLAGLGLVLCFRQVPAPVLAFLLLYSSSIILVFVSSRYRNPVIPAMSVLAAAGVFALGQAVRGRCWSRVLVGAGTAVSLLLLSTLPGPFPQESTDYRAEMDYQVGNRAMNQGQLDRAVELLGQALRRQPWHSDAHNTLGLTYAKQRRLSLAQEHFEKAVQSNPRSVTARDNLGRALAARGDLDGAAHQFRLALKQEPRNADLHFRCGRTLVAQRKFDEAAVHLRRAVEIRPNDADIVYELGRALRGLGDVEQAVAHFKTALRIDGLHRGALDHLAAALVDLGRGREALSLYEAALARARTAGEWEIAGDLEQKLRDVAARP